VNYAGECASRGKRYIGMSRQMGHCGLMGGNCSMAAAGKRHDDLDPIFIWKEDSEG
jgi:hypothetical protein